MQLLQLQQRQHPLCPRHQLGVLLHQHRLHFFLQWVETLQILQRRPCHQKQILPRTCSWLQLSLGIGRIQQDGQPQTACPWILHQSAQRQACLRPSHPSCLLLAVQKEVERHPWASFLL